MQRRDIRDVSRRRYIRGIARRRRGHIDPQADEGMYVVRHHDERSLINIADMIRDLRPTRMRDASHFVQTHDSVSDRPEIRSAVLCAYRDEVPAFGGIIIARQPA